MIAEQSESTDIEFDKQTDNTILLTEQNAQTNIEVIEATTEQKAEILYIEYQPSKPSQNLLTEEFLAAVLADIYSSLADNLIISKADSYLSCSSSADTYDNHQTFEYLPLLGEAY